MGTSEALTSATMKRGERDHIVCMQENGQRDKQRYWNFERVFLLTLLILGFSSVVLGIIAEFYNYKDSQPAIIDGECVYPGDFHITLGVAAAITLFVAEVLVTILGCRQSFAPKSPASLKESSALKFLVGSWFTFAITCYLFMSGMMVTQQNAHYQYTGIGTCKIVKFLVYTKGAALALVTMAEYLAYYIAICEARTIATYTQMLTNDDSVETLPSTV